MGRGREVTGLSRPGQQFSVREGGAARERRRRVGNQFHSEEVEAQDHVVDGHHVHEVCGGELQFGAAKNLDCGIKVTEGGFRGFHEALSDVSFVPFFDADDGLVG